MSTAGTWTAASAPDARAAELLSPEGPEDLRGFKTPVPVSLGREWALGASLDVPFVAYLASRLS
jgi:hypothetical protein